MWHNVPRLLSVGGLDCSGTDCVFGVKDVARLVEQHPSHQTHNNRQQSGDIIPLAVSLSLALLKMGKELPETC